MKTRTLLIAIPLLVLASRVAWCASCSAPPCESGQKIKVLMEVGGPHHDNPELYAMLKKQLEGTGQFAVNVTDNRDEMAQPAIENYDVVLIYTTGGALTEAQEKGLTSFVQGGRSVVGIHSATDSFKDSDAYWKLMCGQFIGHGGGTFRVKITGKSHSIVQGISGFEINDETYKHKFHPDSKMIVLMRREEDGEPASWVQYYGKGRVFVTGLGHGKPAWENPAFQQMIERALLWAAGRLNP